RARGLRAAPGRRASARRTRAATPAARPAALAALAARRSVPLRARRAARSREGRCGPACERQSGRRAMQFVAGPPILRRAMRDQVRIGYGQGFWGDSILGPVRLVREGPLDYLALDYLAEVTMSIMQKLRSRNPKAGFASDFVTMLGRVLPDV